MAAPIVYSVSVAIDCLVGRPYLIDVELTMESQMNQKGKSNNVTDIGIEVRKWMLLFSVVRFWLRRRRSSSQCTPDTEIQLSTKLLLLLYVPQISLRQQTVFTAHPPLSLEGTARTPCIRSQPLIVNRIPTHSTGTI